MLAEVGVRGSREATREGARGFRMALEELGTTYIKLGQLLSSRPDLLPDVYIDELSHLVDEVPPVAFAEIDAVASGSGSIDAKTSSPRSARIVASTSTNGTGGTSSCRCVSSSM